jgi:uncharacterized protein (TIGR00730 family)
LLPGLHCALHMADQNQHSYTDVLRTQLVENAELLAADEVGNLNLKMAGTAVSELHGAFRMFGPYRQRRKVTVFGSARVKPGGALYEAARALAEDLARDGWMVVTGAGPGIMRAATEGAGNENAIGVTIQLPFETSEGAALIDAERVAQMKYFFTRKLMLCKESHAFVSLPGGYGTQDETFEMLTLVQTGKSVPVPLVLLDAPGGTYWADWQDWVQKHLCDEEFIDAPDMSFFFRTDDAEEARAYIEQFYRVYDSCRWAGDRLIMRLKKRPTDEQLKALNEEFADSCVRGSIEHAEPIRGELLEEEKLDLVRIALYMDRKKNGRLQELIGAVNRW